MKKLNSVLCTRFSRLGHCHWFGIHTFRYSRIRSSRNFLHVKHRKKTGNQNLFVRITFRYSRIRYSRIRYSRTLL